MKKILLLHTGGTFGMVPMEPDQVLTPGNLQQELKRYIPEIMQIADLDIKILFNEDSANLAVNHWEILAKTIDKNMSMYDGFVIIHGTDTMVYTAAALSFSLINLKKPVILTGAQVPLSKQRSDARQNLIDALEVATHPLSEVLIVFGQKILRGNRARKTSITSYGAFFSPNFPVIGNIGIEVEIDKTHTLESKDDYKYLEGFNTSLLSIHIYPGCDPNFYKQVLDNPHINVILLIGFGAGNIPVKENNWLTFIKDAVIMGKNVFVNSSSGHGGINLELYENGKMIMDAGAIGCKDMTVEASIVKIMKSLAQSTEPVKVQQFFLYPLSGEIGS